MKRMLISLSAIVSACALNASIGDVIGGAIDSSIGVVRGVAHDASHYVHRDRYIRANSAFDQRSLMVDEQLRELQSENVSLDQKKQNIGRIIALSNEMVDSLAPELSDEQVQNLKAYVNNEVKRIKDFQSTNNLDGVVRVAYDLMDYLENILDNQ